MPNDGSPYPRDFIINQDGIIAYANNNNKKLKDLSLTELKTFNRNISNSAKKVLSSVESIKNKTSFGGTSPQSVKKTIQYAIKKYL